MLWVIPVALAALGGIVFVAWRLLAQMDAAEVQEYESHLTQTRMHPRPAVSPAQFAQRAPQPTMPPPPRTPITVFGRRAEISPNALLRLGWPAWIVSLTTVVSTLSSFAVKPVTCSDSSNEFCGFAPILGGIGFAFVSLLILVLATELSLGGKGRIAALTLGIFLASFLIAGIGFAAIVPAWMAAMVAAPILLTRATWRIRDELLTDYKSALIAGALTTILAGVVLAMWSISLSHIDVTK